VLISPPFTNPPKFVVKGKSLKIEFQDTLQDLTTYTINFGSSIKDITEGNVLENFSYVFSTGPYLDSLIMEGKVFNAETNKPEKETLVLIYSDLSDSVVVTERPDYFTKTEENGSFRIQNLKKGTYKLVALKDINFNLQFDLPSELIGFHSEPVQLNDSSNSYEISVFTDEPSELKLTGYKPDKPGKVILTYNSPLSKFDIKAYPVEVNQFYLNKRKDSVFVWLSSVYTRKTRLVCTANSSISDSIKINFRMSLPDSSRKNQLKPIFKRKTSSITEVTKDLPFSIKFNRPVKVIANNKFKLYRDSLLIGQELTFVKDSTDPTRVLMACSLESGFTYKLLVLPKAVTDIYEFYNDSLSFQLNRLKNNELGSIKLDFTGGVTNRRYILNIYNVNGAVRVRDSFVAGEIKEMHFRGLKPGQYKIVVIEDEHENGKWDTGNYFKHRQPERKIFYEHDIELRANWEFEAEINID